MQARVDVERTASRQLESVREELATTQTALGKLRAESDAPRSRRPAGATALVEASGAPLQIPALSEAGVTAGSSPAVSAPVEERPRRVIRELSDTDRERIDRLEHQSGKDRARAQELERDVKRIKGRSETQQRMYVVTRGELDLAKDKFKALEKRLNRVLLERDLMRRAIKDLEKKSGISAERTEPTADELAASDQKVDDRVIAEKAEVERRESVAKAETERVAAQEASALAAPAQNAAATESAPTVESEKLN